MLSVLLMDKNVFLAKISCYRRLVITTAAANKTFFHVNQIKGIYRFFPDAPVFSHEFMNKTMILYYSCQIGIDSRRGSPYRQSFTLDLFVKLI